MEAVKPKNQVDLAEKVKTLFASQGPLCDSEGFYNHEGECWNDALQMLLLYSDGLKESVQSKLAEGPIDPVEVDELFRPDAVELLEKLESNTENSNNETPNLTDENRVQFELLYVSLVYEYLLSLQKRFHRHYYAESLRLTRLRNDQVCTLEENKGLSALQQLKEISLAFRSGGKEGLHSGFFGQAVQLKNIFKRRDPRKLQNLYEPGGSKESEIHIMRIFYLFFHLHFQTYHNQLSTKYGVRRLRDRESYDLFSIKPTTIGLFCGIGSGENSHAVSFFTCGGRDYYFDDNRGSIQFPWRQFFDHLQEKQTEEMIAAETHWEGKRKRKKEADGFVDWEIYFCGELTVQDSKKHTLFTIESYPILYRIAWEKDLTSLHTEIRTYLPDGTLVQSYLGKKDSLPFVYTTVQKINDGEELTITFSYKKAKDEIRMIFQLNSSEALPKINTRNQSGTILGARLYHKNSTVLELTLESQLEKVKAKKAHIDDVFYKDTHSFTPLLLAIYMNKPTLVQRVLEMGASVSKKTNNRSPLYSAVAMFTGTSTEILELLIKYGADVNDLNNGIGGYTPLVGAILNNEEDDTLDQITFLLDHGADVNIQSHKSPATAAEYANFLKQGSVVRLLTGKNIDDLPCPPKEKFLSSVDGDSLVMKHIRMNLPIQAGNLAKCYRILELYDELNFENKVGDTALKLAISMPDTSWTKELLDYLIWNGADVNHVDRFGSTPLYLAISLGRTEIVEQLLENGAKPNVIVEQLGSPVHYAKQQGHPAIVKLLEEELRRPRYKKSEKATRKRKKQLGAKKTKNYSFAKRSTKRALNKAKANLTTST